MLTKEQLNSLMTVDINNVNIKELIDISSLTFDNDLPEEKRLEYIAAKLKNPFCFRYGEMGIKLEFDDNGPPLQEVLTNFFIRQKNGL